MSQHNSTNTAYTNGFSHLTGNTRRFRYNGLYFQLSDVINNLASLRFFTSNTFTTTIPISARILFFHTNSLAPIIAYNDSYSILTTDAYTLVYNGIFLIQLYVQDPQEIVILIFIFVRISGSCFQQNFLLKVTLWFGRCPFWWSSRMIDSSAWTFLGDVWIGRASETEVPSNIKCHHSHLV